METVVLKSSSKAKMASLLKIAKEMGIDVVMTNEELDEMDGIMALPGPEVSKEKFEAWLAAEDDVEYTIEEATKLAKEKLAEGRKNRK